MVSLIISPEGAFLKKQKAWQSCKKLAQTAYSLHIFGFSAR
jgi:hypothetical protein